MPSQSRFMSRGAAAVFRLGAVLALIATFSTNLVECDSDPNILTHYIAPDYGSTDVSTCGRTREDPCNGIVSIINQGCVRPGPTKYELRLLPGRFIMPVFSGPKLLAACDNFTVVSDSESYDVTVVVNPFEVLSPGNETYQPDNNKIGEHNKDVCGLNDAANLFGVAAFSFENSTNVLLRYLIFEMASTGIDLFITMTNVGNFNMEHCRFLRLPTLRQAIGILNPVGAVTIVGCTFEKLDHASSADNLYESTFNNLQIQAAVYVFQTVPAPPGAAVYIQNNNFTIVRSTTPLPWSYQSWQTYISRTELTTSCRTTSLATLLRIRFDAYASGISVFVVGNNFLALGPRYTAQSIGSAMSVAIKCNAQNNTVGIVDNAYEGHVAQHGSGTQVSITGLVKNNTVIMTNLTYLSNGLTNWTQEGGAVQIFASDYQLETNNVVLAGIIFRYNRAWFGSAIHIERRYQDYDGCTSCIASYSYSFCSLFPAAHVTPDPETFPRREYILANLTVDQGLATRGAIHAKHVVLLISGLSMYSYNFGGAMYLSDSEVIFEGNCTFFKNEAERGGAIALYDGSQISVNTTSSTYFNPGNVVTFRSNFAINMGGAIYAGQKSSTLDYNEVVERGLIGLQFSGQSCFIATPPIFVDYDCSKSMAYFVFDSNGACIQGQDIFSYSLLECRQIVLLPQQSTCPLAPTLGSFTASIPFQQRSLTSYNYSTEGGGVSGTHAPIVSTSSNYLMFRGASCSCRKIVGNSMFILSTCNGESTMAFLARSQRLVATSGVILDQLPQFRFTKSTGDHLPSPGDFWLPWAGTFVSDADAQLFTSISFEDPDAQARIGIDGATLVQDPSNILLMPAPGEEFHLNVSALDELLGNSRASAYVQVQATPPTNYSSAVLLRINRDFQLSAADKIPFEVGQPLVGVSLVGMPGTEAVLRISVPSLLVDKDIELFIPFKLAPCPHGFRNPTLYDPSLPENQSYVPALSLVKRASTGLVPREYADGSDPLACNCDLDNDAIASCGKGKQVYIKSSQWGGIVPSSNMENTVVDKYKCNNTEIDINGTSFQELDVICLKSSVSSFEFLKEINSKSSLLYGDCVRETCKGTKNAQRLKTTGIAHKLFVSEEVSTPCSGDTEGLLCGRCKNGTTLTPYYVHCKDCRGAKPYYVLATTLVTGLLLFFFGIYFTWGVSPTLVSVLFFCQAVALIVRTSPNLPRGQEYITQTLNLDFSLGLCFMETFTALDRILWSYFPPGYFLFLLLVSYLLSNIQYLVKVFARRNCIRMFWLVILLSYGSVSSTAVKTLRCSRIYPRHAAVELIQASLRLTDDEEIICWEGRHLVAAVVANFLVVFILIPLPIILPFLHKWPRFKPFSDVYNSLYRTDRRAWSGIDLFRRLLLANAVNTLQDPVDQHTAGVICCMVFLGVHSVFSPFEKKENNVIEAVLLTTLCIITNLAGPNAGPGNHYAIQALFFSVLGMIAVYKTYYYMQHYKLTVQRMTYEHFGISLGSYEENQKEDVQKHIKLVSVLRDPLLQDHFDDSGRGYSWD